MKAYSSNSSSSSSSKAGLAIRAQRREHSNSMHRAYIELHTYNLKKGSKKLDLNAKAFNFNKEIICSNLLSYIIITLLLLNPSKRLYNLL